MVRLVLLFLFTLSVIACGKKKADSFSGGVWQRHQEHFTTKWVGVCEQAPVNVPVGGFEGKDLPTFFEENGVKEVQKSPEQYLIQFAHELIKMPLLMRKFLVGKGVQIHTIFGKSVKDDPSFSPREEKTFDGRQWDTIVGTGGNPTRVVVNSLYENHGCSSVVLHEHAHTLDLHSSWWRNLSSAKSWKAVMAEPQFAKLISENCGKYCTENPPEAFAEAFALYYNCEKSRQILAASSAAIAYFKDLESQY